MHPGSKCLSIGHFDLNIRLSPRYADAYVGLADGWSLMSSDGFIDPRYLSVDSIWDGMRDDARVRQIVAAMHPNW